MKKAELKAMPLIPLAVAGDDGEQLSPTDEKCQRISWGASPVPEPRVAPPNRSALPLSRPRLGVRQPSGAFGTRILPATVPEDWRTPKPCGASAGSWKDCASVGTFHPLAETRGNEGQSPLAELEHEKRGNSSFCITRKTSSRSGRGSSAATFPAVHDPPWGGRGATAGQPENRKQSQ